jgi:hypothetical protein
MKAAIIAPVFALALSGCAGLNPTSVNNAITGVNTTVAEIQQLTRAVCLFVPAASTVSSLLSQWIPGLTSAQSIATSICSAVAPASVATARRGRSGPPVVNGVVIHGRFVR